MTYALADCNNFYVSCERAFDPSLRNRPVIVLSSNDGCAISRSAEAKVAGITMGMPLFKARPLIAKHRIVVLSSNFALYGSMSRRVMDVIGTFPIHYEVYSIDEAFIEFPRSEIESPAELCRLMRERVLQWTGIPISIGIGETKTLAKLANRMVKVSEATDGVLSLCDPERLARAMEQLPAGDVWGVGHGIRQDLLKHGIQTVAQLRDLNTGWVKSEFGIKGLALVLELRGQVCHQLRQGQARRKMITVTRTFSRRLRGFDTIAPAFTTFAQRAAKRLSDAGLVTKSITAFIATDPFQLDPQVGSSVKLSLDMATDNVDDIIYYGNQALRKILNENLEYKKGGIILGDLAPNQAVQATFFNECDVAREAIQVAIKPSGSAAVEFENIDLWEQKAEHISPRYTTRWDQLPRTK